MLSKFQIEVILFLKNHYLVYNECSARVLNSCPGRLGPCNNHKNKKHNGKVLPLINRFFRHLQRLCPSEDESFRQECHKLCSAAEGRYQEICRGFLETTTAAASSLVTSTVTALTSSVTNSLQVILLSSLIEF